MSRYRIPHEAHEAWCGWDNPLQTLFLQVFQAPEPDDDIDDVTLLWVGTKHDEIKSVDQLQQHFSSYGVIGPNIVAKLEADMAAATPRTPLQERIRAILQGTEGRGAAS